jgi:hypothetical protein
MYFLQSYSVHHYFSVTIFPLALAVRTKEARKWD